MPKSRTRQKSHYTAPQEGPTKPAVNAPWFLPVMLGLLVLGLLWIVVTYLTNFDLPIPGIGSWNLAVGFAFALVGLGMATRWR
ncbi:cell division protein CrgA [Cellulomonas sp. Marseille-Q8402]